MIATFPSLKIDIDKYPAVKSYLKSYGKRLEQSGESYSDETGKLIKCRKKTNNKWFETQDSISYWEEFNRQKIVWASVGLNEYSFVDKNYYLLDTNYFAVGLSEYHLAILNSTLIIKAIIEKNDTKVGTIAYRHYKYNFETIPVPKVSKSIERLFCSRVDKLISSETSKLEQSKISFIIDLMVYKVYMLSFDEVLFIDESINISRKDYDNLTIIDIVDL